MPKKSRRDPPESIPLTPKEQAFFDVLNDEPQTGPDLIAKLRREGYREKFSEPEISRMAKRPHLEARGARHRKRAGYYKIVPRSTPPASTGVSIGEFFAYQKHGISSAEFESS